MRHERILGNLTTYVRKTHLPTFTMNAGNHRKKIVHVARSIFCVICVFKCILGGRDLNFPFQCEIRFWRISASYTNQPCDLLGLRKNTIGLCEDIIRIFSGYPHISRESSCGSQNILKVHQDSFQDFLDVHDKTV